MPTTTFFITNITCPACVKLSEMALKKIPGVTEVQIDQKTGATTVESEHDIKDQVIPALKKVDKEVAF